MAPAPTTTTRSGTALEPSAYVRHSLTLDTETVLCWWRLSRVRRGWHASDHLRVHRHSADVVDDFADRPDAGRGTRIKHLSVELADSCLVAGAETAQPAGCLVEVVLREVREVIVQRHHPPVPLIWQRRLTGQPALDLRQMIQKMIRHPAQHLKRRPGVPFPADRTPVPAEPSLRHVQDLGHGGWHQRRQVPVVHLRRCGVVGTELINREVSNHAATLTAGRFGTRRHVTARADVAALR